MVLILASEDKGKMYDEPTIYEKIYTNEEQVYKLYESINLAGFF